MAGEERAAMDTSILIYVLRDQQRSEQGTAQISTQMLAERLEQEHGHVSVAQARTGLSALIDKGMVDFKQQMGGFQIVQCSVNPKGMAHLREHGIDPDALPAEAEPTVEVQANSEVQQSIQVATDIVQAAEMDEGDRAEVLAALGLLGEAAPSRGRVRCALRSLRELGPEIGLDLEHVSWAHELA